MICVIVVFVPLDTTQELREIMAREQAQFQRELRDFRAQQHHISCSCGWQEWYQTPGRAKMGLRAHQQRRKCR